MEADLSSKRNNGDSVHRPQASAQQESNLQADSTSLTPIGGEVLFVDGAGPYFEQNASRQKLEWTLQI